MSRRAIGWAAASLLALLTVAGTVLWIAGIARPAPAVATGRIVAEVYRAPRLTLTVAIGDGAAGYDRAGGTMLALARAAAQGALAGGRPLRLVEVGFLAGRGRQAMRLDYDPGVIAAAAVAGATPGHLLDLAGEGSVWPDAGDAAARAYCGRFETAGKPFCERVGGAR